MQMEPLSSVLKKKSDSRTSLYKQIKEGLFPPGVKLGARRVAWPDYEVESVLKARIAGQTDDQIRALVAELQANRKAGVSV
ncbi:MAG: AlpA family phage regulatory protein [Chitinophagia bacterium]|jgi:prophage regulatory protein|nr:AlpA family phage regulatory protein [Chitinophagia bacterium]